MLIALKVCGAFLYDGVKLKGVGSLTSYEVIVFFCGLVLVFLFRALGIKGAVLLSIIGASVIAGFLGIGKVLDPIVMSKDMFSGIFAMDLKVIFNPKIWSIVLILFILDFYGSIAKFIGLTRNTSIVDKDGNMPQMQEALTVDGLGTVLGASLGTSNLITYVESAVGIGEGGRTGLTAVVCALLMSLFLFLTPLVNLVPVVATTGALFYVGLMLFPKKDELQNYDWFDIAVLAIMVLVTIATFALDRAMCAGFVFYILFLILRGKAREVNVYLAVSAAVLLLSTVI